MSEGRPDGGTEEGDGAGTEEDEGPPEIEGLSVEEAVERIADEDPDSAPRRVRTIVRQVADDGVVSREAAEDTLGDLAKVVATPETRVELASDAVEAAREAAEGVEDLPSVAARLESVEDDLAETEAAVENLAGALDELSGHLDDGPLFNVGFNATRVRTDAKTLQANADQLKQEADDLRRWIEDPDSRHEEFEGDLDALESFVGEVEDSVDRLAAGAGGGTVGDPAGEWADAALRQRVVGLLLADLRAELSDLRTWADREDVDPPGEEFDDRLDDLADRAGEAGERLADHADPGWRELHGPRVAEFEATLAEYDPPVPWGEVLSELEEAQRGLGPGDEPPGRGR